LKVQCKGTVNLCRRVPLLREIPRGTPNDGDERTVPFHDGRGLPRSTIHRTAQLGP
jgi:hypothetical protein